MSMILHNESLYKCKFTWMVVTCTLLTMLVAMIHKHKVTQECDQLQYITGAEGSLKYSCTQNQCFTSTLLCD